MFIAKLKGKCIDFSYTACHYICIVVVQLLSHVQLFVTPQTETHQASLSLTNSQSFLKLMFIDSVLLSNHLILFHPLLLLLSTFPNISLFQ